MGDCEQVGGLVILWEPESNRILQAMRERLVTTTKDCPRKRFNQSPGKVGGQHLRDVMCAIKGTPALALSSEIPQKNGQ